MEKSPKYISSEDVKSEEKNAKSMINAPIEKYDNTKDLFIENLYSEYQIRANIVRVIENIEAKLAIPANRIYGYTIFAKKLIADNAYTACNALLVEVSLMI